LSRVVQKWKGSGNLLGDRNSSKYWTADDRIEEQQTAVLISKGGSHFVLDAMLAFGRGELVLDGVDHGFATIGDP
jgi:hypothetical protein